MDKDLATAVECFIDESVGDAEVLPCVLLGFVVEFKVQILEVLCSLGVGLARDVENVSHTFVDEVSSLVGCLVRSHDDAFVDLDESYVSEVDLASADVHVWETAADNVFLLALVAISGLRELVFVVEFVHGWSSGRLDSHELRDRNLVDTNLRRLLVFLGNLLELLFLGGVLVEGLFLVLLIHIRKGLKFNSYYCNLLLLIIAELELKLFHLKMKTHFAPANGSFP